MSVLLQLPEAVLGLAMVLPLLAGFCRGSQDVVNYPLYDEFIPMDGYSENDVPLEGKMETNDGQDRKLIDDGQEDFLKQGGHLSIATDLAGKVLPVLAEKFSNSKTSYDGNGNGGGNEDFVMTNDKEKTNGLKDKVIEWGKKALPILLKTASETASEGGGGAAAAAFLGDQTKDLMHNAIEGEEDSGFKRQAVGVVKKAIPIALEIASQVAASQGGGAAFLGDQTNDPILPTSDTTSGLTSEYTPPAVNPTSLTTDSSDGGLLDMFVSMFTGGGTDGVMGAEKVKGAARGFGRPMSSISSSDNKKNDNFLPQMSMDTGMKQPSGSVLRTNNMDESHGNGNDGNHNRCQHFVEDGTALLKSQIGTGVGLFFDKLCPNFGAFHAICVSLCKPKMTGLMVHLVDNCNPSKICNFVG